MNFDELLNENDEMLIRESHYVYSLHFHLVFVTKYRRKVFITDQQQEQMKDLLRNIADENDIKIENVEVMPDHVHILFSAKPKYALSDIVKKFKGISSRYWRLNHPETRRYCGATIYGLAVISFHQSGTTVLTL